MVQSPCSQEDFIFSDIENSNKIYKNLIMSLLSITFHCPEPLLGQWEKYLSEQLVSHIENYDLDKYILSEVYTEMITEGKNYNLLIFFKNKSDRNTFINQKFRLLQDTIESVFGEDIMIFETHLNRIK